ncbi:dipeptide/oligopeptide/nickel ABC transporter permease/ATP-binding protein [Cellulomonas oligotrophica]|uniref:ABC-type dipeptide/oligopeptide/nickel transport system ATPase component/ABC-type dipeptide/oligopeptide/nickel transport system permease subunit n=1 Tax=Cellulomonas oligotrophica TaxID=931536 RepID=A0A7Y9JX58_9CELL|nr:dipeptide/oligopeptide/nickel ABC transporter permease/ATP-binding protein [Cellulomonas oligotrophica]NYD85307.1 ABC-type dipeptide/oligopeptide/nickel transport system ATPase component/ABC-type dipeptide/oligopeptide/nickel transport system permease subunit [Cellulomonas oligotrophica]GIG33258.1 dipeptide/oligopeptide/nickel ABC transporter ATP-binding protein [Cellulomonas oligotrophica]
MSDVAPTPAGSAATADRSVVRRLLHDPLGAVALGFLALVVLAVTFAPLLTPHDATTAVITDALAAPGEGGHLLGADSAGRDVWARLLFGGRFSLLGALLALTVAVVVGGLSGLVAGYVGRWFDTLASGAAAVLMALPGIVVLLAARSVIGPSAWWAMAIFGVLLSASVFRLVRQTVQSVRGELYVDAARVAGLSDTRIVLRHVLRVVRAPIIIQAAFIASVAIAVQAGLEFLGLGDLTLPTWGGMLNDGFSRIYQQPLLVVWPALAISLVCLALTLVANALRDALEGTGSARRPRPAPATSAVQAAPAPGAASADERTILQVEGLRVGYAMPDGTTTEVVHGVDLTVRRGEVVGLVGESGSGKTQTAFSVLRLLPEGGAILGGRVLWKGRDLAALSAREMTAVRGAQIAYVPQEPMSNLDPSFTIGSQLVEPMRVHLGLSRVQARARALELLDRVGIRRPEQVLRAYPHEVSGGMAQRVLIAGAISCRPELLIADEPTTALDMTVQADILDLLRDLQAELDMGVLLVTHNFGVVADLCDRVAVMQDGLVVERGATRDLFVAHEHPYTTQLFDAILDPAQVREPYRPPHADARPQEVGQP